MSFKTGERVKHVTQTSWGTGLVRVDTLGEYTTVFFAEAGEKKIRTEFLRPVEGEEAESSLLDNLKKGGQKGKVSFRTITQLKDWFLRAFPEGFYGSEYLEKERNYKVEAHDFFRSVLDRTAYSGLLAAENYAEITKLAMQVVNKTNLIFPNEKMSLKDGLQDASNQKLFATSLFDLLFGEAELQARFESFAKMLESIGAAKWTIMTYFPFLFDPVQHMFVKPMVTRAAAEICMFELNYRPELNWITYHHVLRFSADLRDKLADLKPRDFIDVQSFMWCAERMGEND